MRIVYFASVRENIGIDAEDRDLPEEIASISDLLDWLAKQSEQYAAAFTDRSRLRFAIDHNMVTDEALLSGATEIAVFPPVTGG